MSETCGGSGTHNKTIVLHGTVKLKQTNADRIRSMSDKELAVQIALPYLASPPWCDEHKTCPYISEDPAPCDRCALDWLKQEVGE